ncbi:MAG: DnaJ domain-containing protein [Nitrospinae bacterium]|nr:DnaJ domain-containing protein [Nitrospinota bacterium]
MSNVKHHDFYQVLGVRSGADFQEIETAYRQLMAQQDSAAAQQTSFLEDASSKWRADLIQEAYATLSDEIRRQAYDQQAMIKSGGPQKTAPAPNGRGLAPRKSSLLPELDRGEKKNRQRNIYQDYFGFSEKPFDLTPDPKYLYLSPKHKEVLAHLVYGMQENNGFLKIVGEVGTGKTTICRSFLRELHGDFHIAYILNPCVNALEL